ncbi:MAG: agmatinase [Firmicutes bacterium]|nr:agmatinase [Bacillota bacterium]NBI62304.1 agmatinase [Clostridiales bacterium]
MLENLKLLNDSWLRWGAASKEDAKICVMGVPFDNAVSLNKGAAKGPETMRSLSVDMSDATEDDIVIKEGLIYDIGDIPVDLDWERYFKTVAEEAYELMKTGNFCLFLGGDHSVTIPLHQAFGKYQKEKKENAKIGIVHFDAHYDLCNEYDGHKWSHACTEARSLENVISGEDLFFVGVRVAEKSELELIAKNPGITSVKAKDVHNNGVEPVFQMLKDKFHSYDAVYLTIDIDVLDPAFAPGTGTPQPGGLTSMQLIQLFQMMLEELPIKAMDIVEVAPDLDVNHITSWAALRLILDLFGHFSK